MSNLSVVVDQSVRDDYSVKSRVRSHIAKRMSALDLSLTPHSGDYLAFEGDMAINDARVTALLAYCDRYNIGASYGKR